jgi:hypothetical protein
MVWTGCWDALWWDECCVRDRADADADAEAARRVPSEKQEPHTMMWGTTPKRMAKLKKHPDKRMRGKPAASEIL